MSELRGKTEQSFVDMNEWLGARYLREMAAVDALTTYARQHIEDAEKLNLELKLEQDVSLLLFRFPLNFWKRFWKSCREIFLTFLYLALVIVV